ncbi:phytanoyl-CoA dioxygenase family protein [Pseudomonas gingeri]|uniref:Phytanoyl-CoA dioxygenase family protein n=1 Tax=Pseudomonas gingeri TaxID=117681 RepID=A0A7Y7WKW2_9PSED|nr:phytanoyl-CoA dioxygenase family protein [Pseudomonas gingeri]NWB51093.1 phytanoyl-CoA dioxygenase family protein [Pseudomonas gingeri]NWB97660.1 phytanoyl-CoA dioxygenase family protein [Pseudomonas gingeri]
MNKTTNVDSRESMTGTYSDSGFYLAQGLLESKEFSEIEAVILETVTKHYPCESIHSKELADYLRLHPDTVTKIYDTLQSHESLINLGKLDVITNIIRSFISEPAIYLKVVLRIDTPFESRELAYWHQDDYYVKGNETELTVWIPLQDTSVPQGCLSVMPGSHKLGRLEHSYASGKKNIPQGIYDREVRLVEMVQGDALFFSSLLVHSSNFNFSENIRYSIQIRYTASDKKPSHFMRGTINV